MSSVRSRMRDCRQRAEREVPGGRAGPARRRRLPQCPPPHCFPSKRIPAKPSPGTRKFPGATPPAAAMETAPASQGGSPGTLLEGTQYGRELAGVISKVLCNFPKL